MKFVKKIEMSNGKTKALLVAEKKGKVKVSMGVLGKKAQIGSVYDVRLHGKSVLTISKEAVEE